MRRNSVAMVVATWLVTLVEVPAWATEGDMVVKSDTTLTEDHRGNVLIEAGGVTLDCDGHTVTNADIEPQSRRWPAGILVAPLTVGVVVRNCVVDEGRIYAYGGQEATETSPRVLGNSTLENNLFIGWSYLEVAGGGGNTIVGNEASGTYPAEPGDRSDIGFVVSSDDNIFRDNLASENSFAGFAVDATADRNVFIDNLALDNSTGFIVFAGAPVPKGNEFRSNRAFRNGVVGFRDDSFRFDGGTGTSGTWNTYSNNRCASNAHDPQSNPPGLCTILGEGRFIDDDDSTFEADIEWLAVEQLTKGCDPPENIRYCPDDQVSRGELAVFLDRIFDYTGDGGGDLFIDDDGRFYEDSADRLKIAGITNGCNPPVNDLYCGDRPVTRGEFAALFVRAIGYVDSGGGDLFTDDNDSQFEDSIDKLAAAGVTRGCDPPTRDRFCPGDSMTRGQLAAFVHRAFPGR